MSCKLDLETAVAGDGVTIDVPTQVSCDTCNGSGARKGSEPVKCTTCGGVGQVRMQQGFFLYSTDLSGLQRCRHDDF